MGSTTKWHSRCLPAFLLALLVAPSPSRANGIFGDMLNKTVGTVISKMKNQVNAVARPAPATQSPGQPVPTQAVEGSSGNAPQNPNGVPLVRTFQPAIPSYSGAAEDLVGVRLGMPLAQAEKIANKTYPSSPVVQWSKYRIAYKEVAVESQPFVQYVEYTKTTTDTTDQLLLGFNSPVGDGRVVSMERLINFAPHAADEPLVSSIQASLFKKYGTPSGKNTSLGTQFWWAYSQKGRLPCESGDCFVDYNASYGVGAPTFGGRMTALHTDGGEFNLSPDDNSIGHVSPSVDLKLALTRRCGAFIVNSNKLVADDVVRIWTSISSNSADSSKAAQMELDVYYSKPCVDDALDARTQMQTAALKRYHAISKTPAAPAF